MIESEKTKSEPQMPESEFERLNPQSQLSLPQEFALFLVENKKWWLLPIVIVVAMVSLLVSLSSTGAAPFIYTLF